MKLSSTLVSIGCALTLAAAPVSAQLNDGKPDPDQAMPAALNLKYALAFALDNNFSIRQAKERIRQQEGIILQVRAAEIPHVSASGTYERNSTEISSSGQNKYWGVSITAQQALYSGGGVQAGVKSQQLAMDAAVLELQAVINEALLDVRTRFYNVLVAREVIKVQEENVELIQRQLRDVQNRFEAGTVSNFEVLRAQVAVANAKAPLITARNGFRLAIEELRFALGFATKVDADVAKVPEFLGSLDFFPASFDLRAALDAAREHRPDLQRLTKLVDAAEQGVFVSQANYRPNLSLFGSYAVVQAPASVSASHLDGWTVGLQSQWNIFDGRATSGRVAQSRSLLEQARLSLAEAQLSADVEVRRSISTFQQATELAEASKKVVEQAEEAVRLANARYAAGTATQLDVLTSQVDLTTARLNQVRAFYSYNVAVATTRKAMGLADEMKPDKEMAYPTP